ncbi:MAG: hypothetical protein SPI03_00660 [Campylobacter sputorum]|uniref:hypothetical protein n=1 Tax=Campylobacter sputorum TaxID=206 RepID=UPI00053C0003|nr:hypothetical protein [Campylobacter sputorum]MDY6119839.1 hypothetical protein [Campylobacter sputorum]
MGVKLKDFESAKKLHKTMQNDTKYGIDSTSVIDNSAVEFVLKKKNILGGSKMLISTLFVTCFCYMLLFESSKNYAKIIAILFFILFFYVYGLSYLLRKIILYKNNLVFDYLIFKVNIKLEDIKALIKYNNILDNEIMFILSIKRFINLTFHQSFYNKDETDKFIDKLKEKGVRYERY